jgi:Fe-S-cluster containining protein
VETLKWYLHFDTIQIYIRRRRWNMLFQGKCAYLSKKNLCTIYDKRPEICRAYRPNTCERTSQWYDTILSTADDLESYLKTKRGRT